MTNNTIRAMSIALLGLSLGLWGSIIIPSMHIKKTATITETVWQEQPRPLTEIEQATMSADFITDFEKNLEKKDQSPTPTPFLTADVPASMADDLAPPTITISGGPVQGTTTAMPDVCFPLWVSDNMTPWQQLSSRGKLDEGQWSTWSTATSYCYQNLGNGTHTFTVQLRDLAGNVSPEVTRTFIVKR